MPSDPDYGSDSECYLTDVSPRDKPWDAHRKQADQVRQLYRGTFLDSYAGRISQCSGQLEFTWVTDLETEEVRFKLKSARFCRVRHCPVCQWRRSLMWVARFLKALPDITRDYPKARYIWLTLTVRNCELTELRTKLAEMNKAWQRMSQRKVFPAIGFARSTEVTRSKDGQAHPHFHALLMVEEKYFQGKYYLSQQDWITLWREALRVEYDPSVRVKTVKPNKRHQDQQEGAGGQAAIAPIMGAVVETFKYSVKPSDLVGKGSEMDQQWLLELTTQLNKTRAVALGGVFKQYMSEEEPEDLIGEDEETEPVEPDVSIWFGWREMVQRYAKQ